MRILIDTNILIHRESNDVVPKELRNLLRIASEIGGTVLTHPLSKQDLLNDKDEDRKNIILSKLEAYQELDNPPTPDNDFLLLCKGGSKKNDEIDNVILYSVYKQAVNYLVTEDKGLIKKAGRCNLSDRVFNISQAEKLFQLEIKNEELLTPATLKIEKIHNLDFQDPIFESFRNDYPEFDQWLSKIAKEGRSCAIHQNEDDSLGAILIWKFENELIDCTPPILQKERLKVCTLKVSKQGYKIGELLLKQVVNLAAQNSCDEVYLTHFTESNDFLVKLINEYGFEKVGVNSRGEEIFLKHLLAPKESEDIVAQIPCKYYPSFYDGPNVKKFCVPIYPEFYKRLFPESQVTIELQETKQLSLFDPFENEIITEGNTIKKAYLSHSHTTKISPGDLLLFYIVNPHQCIGAIGIVQEVYFKQKNPSVIFELVKKRTVYSLDEIFDFANKPVLVILFTFHQYPSKIIDYKRMRELGLLQGPPQSITELSQYKYEALKQEGIIDERFTVN